MRRAALRRMLGLLRGDRSGMALVEFAMVLPVLVLLFISSFQMLDAYSTYRKVTTTVRTLADLTTQSQTLTSSQATDILNASQQVMAPFSTAPATMRVTQIKISAALQPTVDWSRSLPAGSGYTPGAAIAVPAYLLQANTYLIYSQISYAYTPKIASTLIGPLTFTDQIYMSPRNSSSVACATC